MANKIKKERNIVMSIEKKISLLLEKKKQIDIEIQQLKAQNLKILSKALAKITEIENLDFAIILGAVLQVTQNISEEKKEVLLNAGNTFLKRYKLSKSESPESKKE